METVSFATWPADDEKRLREMWAEGLTLAQIADALGRNPKAVQGKVQRSKLPRRHMPSLHRDPQFLALRAEGLTAKQIGEAMGASTKRVQQWISNAIREGAPKKVQQRTVWVGEKAAELTRLWGQGLGPAMIARRMGVSAYAVHNAANRLGLPRNRTYPAIRKAAPVRDYKVSHLRAVARKPKPKVTDTLWNITETSRPWLERESGQCAFPLGEPGDIHSCCAPVLEGDSYCEHHRLIAGGLRIPGGYSGKATADIRRGPASVFDRGRMAA